MRSSIRTAVFVLLLAGLVLPVLVFAAGGSEPDGGEETFVFTGITNYDPQNTGDAETQAYILRKEAYLDANPNIRIDEEVLAFGDMVTKIRTMAAADELPNFFKLGSDVVRTFAEGGAISSIDYIFDRDPAFRNQFVPGSLTNFMHNGNTYGIPVRLSAHLVFYNSDMLSEAGWASFPTTWDEFARMSDDLNATFGSNPNFRPVSFGARASWIVTNLISFLVLQNAGVDWYESLQAGTGAAWTDRPVVEAAEQLQEIIANNSFNVDFASIDQNQHRAYFFARNSAMFFSGNWSTGYVVDNAPEEVLAAARVASFPEIADGAERGVVAGGASWALGLNHRGDAEMQDVLADYFTTVYNNDWAVAMAELGAIPPIALGEGDYDQSSLSLMARQTNDLVAELEVMPTLGQKMPAAFMDTLASETQLLMIGEIDPEEFAANLQETWEELQ